MSGGDQIKALLTLAVLALLGYYFFFGEGSKSPMSLQLSAQNRSDIAAALNATGLPQPQSLEINDTGFLVATFELIVGSAEQPKVFAERALLSIRAAMLQRGVVDKYRVMVTGPSPGPGLTRWYGSARFIEGGSVSWSDGK